MKILYVAPHLSTGGLPQYLYWKCKEFAKENDVYVVEYSCISKDFVIQRNKIKNFVGTNRFYSLEGNDEKKPDKLFEIINEINPDIVHFEEIPETFIPIISIYKFYNKNRNYKIYETSHGSWIGSNIKQYLPDKFIFVTPYQKNNFKDLNVPIEILEYPVIKKERPNRSESLKKLGLDPSFKHILHVGLFAPHKCQHEIFEIARKLEDYNVQFHFIGNTAGNFSHYWKPILNTKPQNCRLWGERNDVDSFYNCMDFLIFPSNTETNPLVPKEALSWNMPILMKELDVYMGMYDNNSLIKYMEDKDSNIDYIKNKLELKRIKKKKKSNLEEIYINFVEEPRVEILNGDPKNEYHIEFIDKENNQVIYESTIKTNHWTKCYRRWYTDWKINIHKNGVLFYEHNYNDKNKNVFITLDSKSLGDTLAWIPYVEEYRKKHECRVICSTFWNDLFIKDYPEIDFVNPGTSQYNLYAMYNVGISLPHDKHKNPFDGFTDNLSKTAAKILGIEYNPELKAKITVNTERKIKQKYVCIGIHSTSQCKYWNYPNGWQDIVDCLKKKGYKVVAIHKEKGAYMGNKTPKGVMDKTGNIDIWDRANDLYHAEFFIGLGSGLSWLANAVGTKTIMIAGHSDPYIEFQTDIIRIKGEGNCVGCFSNPKYTFDKNNWNWCPEDKNFQCTRFIHPNRIKEAIETIEFINKLSSPSKAKFTELVNCYQEIFINKSYFNEKVKIEKDDIVVDIGANIGIFSMFAEFATTKKVICYEAEKENYESLTKNVCKYTETYNMIVSNTNGKQKLYLDEYAGGHAIYHTNNINNTRTTNYQIVESITLDKIIKKLGKIDFLKIDVEGAEREIFTSVKEETLKKIKKISLEFHPYTFKDKYSLNDFIEKISPVFEYEIRKFGLFYTILLNNKNNI